MFAKGDNQDDEPPDLSRLVREYTRQRFRLLSKCLDTLKSFQYDGVSEEQEIRRLLFFSPYRAQEWHLSQKSMAEPEQHLELVLFEGYVDRQGSMHVADRWVPLRQARVAGSVSEYRKNIARS